VTPHTTDDTAAKEAGVLSRAEAAAAFDTPEFVSGTVRLPPLGQKDDESTDNCSQIFCVVSCQPGAVHVSVADKAFLLHPGDHFFVPHKTSYRLRNFSDHTEAFVAFTLLKPQVDADSP